jgi:hypothetical protein
MPLPWIQVDANLKNHRKAVELGALLKDSRAWTYLPELWMWASQSEPSGVVRGEAAPMVLEHVVSWKGEPGALVSALVACGWIDKVDDGLAFHDWADHQGAHIEKAERDAERKRKLRNGWRKSPSRKEKSTPDASAGRRAPVHGTSSASPRDGAVRGRGEGEDIETDPAAPGEPHPADQLQAIWNEVTVPPLPRWQVTGKVRRKLAEAALKRRPPEQWREVFRRINASSFCRGESGGSWRADPDWAMRPDGQKPETAGAVLEGKYDRGGTPEREPGPGEGGKCRLL